MGGSVGCAPNSPKRDRIGGAERVIYNYMVPGTKWGFLECVGVESRHLEDAGGAVQEVIGRGPGVIWRLRCRCGEEFEVVSGEFPGRKKMRNCGREGCEYGDGGEGESRVLGRPRKPGGRKGPVVLYLELEVVERLRKAARQQGVSVSEMVRGVLEREMGPGRVNAIRVLNERQPG